MRRYSEEFLPSILRGLCYVDTLASGVPSWIPTWGFSSRQWLSLRNEIEEDAVDFTQMKISISNDRDVLQTQAILFDRISTVSDPTFERDGLPVARYGPDSQEQKLARYHNEKYDWLAQCERIAASITDPVDTIDERLERFLRCYTLGVEFEENFDFINAYQTYLRLGALMSAIQTKKKNANLIGAHYRQRCE